MEILYPQIEVIWKNSLCLATTPHFCHTKISRHIGTLLDGCKIKSRPAPCAGDNFGQFENGIGGVRALTFGHYITEVVLSGGYGTSIA